eukprot:13916636-Alexandrium_andersonii.AAC.1
MGFSPWEFAHAALPLQDGGLGLGAVAPRAGHFLVRAAGRAGRCQHSWGHRLCAAPVAELALLAGARRRHRQAGGGARA